MARSLWENKTDWIKEQTKHVMTSDNKLVGGEPFALPIYALLTQMHNKKRRSFDGTYYYINLSKRVLRVPHSYRADRCSIVDNYYSVPNMYRMIETAVDDLGDDPSIAPLKAEMRKLRDRVAVIQGKYGDKDKYPYSDLDDQLSPISTAITKKYGLKDGTFSAPTRRYLRWIPPQKELGDEAAATMTLEFTCNVEKFIEGAKTNDPFFTEIVWAFGVSRDDTISKTPMELAIQRTPTNEEFEKLKAQFQTMVLETYGQFKSHYKDYNRKVNEFETDLTNIQTEYKRVYDTYCADAVKDILLVQDFDAII